MTHVWVSQSKNFKKRLKVAEIEGSMLSLDYPDESFDLVWAEGSIFIIGFDQGLEDWRRLAAAARSERLAGRHADVRIVELAPERYYEFSDDVAVPWRGVEERH